MLTNSFKKDVVPLELRVLLFLQSRMQFSDAEKRRLYNLRKGYEGERKIYTISKEKLPPNYFVFRDLLLKSKDEEFQIDILLIGNNTAYLLEVKNYEGDYIIQNQSWYAVSSRTEIRNPLHQLQRTEILFDQFLKQHNMKFSIKPSLIFINENFSLYQVPLELPIVLPTQMNRFIQKLQPSSPNHMIIQQKLAAILTEHKLATSSLAKLPQYHYENLQKGIVCACGSFVEIFNRISVICRKCGQIETFDSAIRRSVDEFITLFPDKKVTTNAVHEWCDIIQSTKTIRRILKKHFDQVGVKNHTHYVKRRSRALLD